MTHFPTETKIAVHEKGPRGITLRGGKTATGENSRMISLLLHNGCGRGNMEAALSRTKAIHVAIELLRLAVQP